MTVYEQIAQMLGEGSDANRFIIGVTSAMHAQDDDVDEARDKERQIKTAAMWISVCSCPFYQRHAEALNLALLLVANDYADSVAWEASSEPWKAAAADVLRHQGNALILATIVLEKDWETMRYFSPLLREASYRQHHTPEGRPT